MPPHPQLQTPLALCGPPSLPTALCAQMGTSYFTSFVSGSAAEPCYGLLQVLSNSALPWGRHRK